MIIILLLIPISSYDQLEHQDSSVLGTQQPLRALPRYLSYISFRLDMIAFLLDTTKLHHLHSFEIIDSF